MRRLYAPIDELMINNANNSINWPINRIIRNYWLLLAIIAIKCRLFIMKLLRLYFCDVFMCLNVKKKLLASFNNHEEACNMLCGKGRVRTHDLGYQSGAL